MKTYYIDCEFDGHNGPLISIALVPESGPSLYIVTDVVPKDEWVQKNVMPIIDSHRCKNIKTVRLNEVGQTIREYLGTLDAHIVADSPVDIGRFCQAVTTSEKGGWQSCGAKYIKFEVQNVDTYPTTLKGAVQHNAWWDAVALRHVLQGGKTVAATSVLYHGTHNVLDILRDKVFRLKPAEGTDAEERFSDTKNTYYLSMMRSPTSRYNRHGYALIELDGNKLANRYKIKPVDYWGYGQSGKELEDRLLSPVQEIGIQAITAIHIPVDKYKDWPNMLFKTTVLAKRLGIPVYFYNGNVIKSTHVSKRIKYVPKLVEKPVALPGTGIEAEPDRRSQYKRRPSTNAWLTLGQRPVNQYLRERFSYQLSSLWNHQSLTEKIKADLFNDRTSFPKAAGQFVQYLRQNKWTIPEFANYLYQKWKN